MGSIIMTIRDRIAALIRLTTIALLLTIPTTPAWAQDEGPGYINFRIQTVKNDRTFEWEALRKEMMEANKKAGRAFYHVYQRQRGPTTTFLIVSPEQGLGEQAPPFEALPELNVPESWFRAIDTTLDGQLVLTLQSYPDLSTLQDGPTHPSEKFLHIRVRTAVAGRSDDFHKWLRDDLIPGLRKADVGDVRVARVILGGSPRTWVTASFVPGWPEPQADVDQRMLAKGDALAATRTDYFYEFREDLSFTAE
jgi:hypothetical protein